MSETISQHLRVSSPSSTAVEYTISSRLSPPSNLATFIRHVFRLIVAGYTTLATIAKLQLTYSAGINPIVNDLLGASLLDSFLRLIIESAPWWLLLATSLTTLYLCIRRDYKEESLLVLKGLGIQTSTTSSYFFLGPTTKFIPATQIQDIVIHEAFRGFGVRFFLAVIVVDAPDVVVVFPNLLPRIAHLEVVWRGSRKCLYANVK